MEDFSFNVEEPAPEYGKQPAYNIKHRAYNFSKELVLYIGTLDIRKIHFPIFDQLVRSGTSIGANVVEGRSGSSINDFFKVLYNSTKIS
jgi:four helix bundle protein